MWQDILSSRAVIAYLAQVVGWSIAIFILLHLTVLILLLSSDHCIKIEFASITLLDDLLVLESGALVVFPVPRSRPRGILGLQVVVVVCLVFGMIEAHLLRHACLIRKQLCFSCFA